MFQLACLSVIGHNLVIVLALSCGQYLYPPRPRPSYFAAVMLHREALEALDTFDPAATTATAPIGEGTAVAEGKGPIEDESSLEDGTIVNMRVKCWR